MIEKGHGCLFREVRGRVFKTVSSCVETCCLLEIYVSDNDHSSPIWLNHWRRICP